MLPIVMGARPADYEKVAPHNSYIHVDQFRGPRDLAEYLLELDRDDKKYNQYFQVQPAKERKGQNTFCFVSVERYRGVHQHKILLQSVCLATC